MTNLPGQNDLAIDATAYGTRWYLTLFNLSIPFPAQLRVWDVFMLLGDCPPEPTPSPPSATASSLASAATAIVVATATTTPPTAEEGEGVAPTPRPKGLDILHATSSALIHALRDVLLDSDFENAMKALTAWIPVQDEDLLMKVARAEWRRHQGGRRLWEGGWEWERRGGGGGKEKVGGKEGKGGVDGKERDDTKKEAKERDRKEKEEDEKERKRREKEEKLKGKEADRKEKGRGMARLWEWERDKGKDKQKEGRE